MTVSSGAFGSSRFRKKRNTRRLTVRRAQPGALPTPTGMSTSIIADVWTGDNRVSSAPLRHVSSVGGLPADITNRALAAINRRALMASWSRSVRSGDSVSDPALTTSGADIWGWSRGINLGTKLAIWGGHSDRRTERSEAVRRRCVGEDQNAE